MAAGRLDGGGNQPESQTSFRPFRQGLDRRRPSKRQTTLRSFKIVNNWSDSSSQAITSSNQQSSVPHSTVTSEDSQNLPVVTSESAQRCHLNQSSKESVPSVPNERTKSPSSEKALSEKTLHSGAGSLKTRKGRKRRQKEVEEGGSNENEATEDEYRANNFVRLFNANQGRKRNMNEITDLDVILTAVEKEALEVRDQIESATGKRAVKEFFTQIRQSFCETIDISKDNQRLKLDLRKAKSKVTKLRKELLSVQQKRTRIAEQLSKEKARYEADSERQKKLKDFSSFLKQLETLNKECRETSSKKPSKEADLSRGNLPSVLVGGHSLLAAASQLKSINDSLQD